MGALFAGMNHVAAAGVAALLNTLWYAGAVVGLTWAILRYAPRVNAATRCWIWTGVLGFLLVLPFLPGAMKQVRTALTARQPATVAATPLARVPEPQVIDRDSTPITLTVDTSQRPNSWPLWLLATWMFAAVWQLTCLVRGVLSVRRLKAQAGSHGEHFYSSWVSQTRDELKGRIRRGYQLLVSEKITSPVAVGYRHPAIIVPPDLLARLDESEKRDVLLHEMAHLVRYDDWLNLATRALGAILVLHPLAAIVMRHIEREREKACDDFVVAHTGSARGYVRSLARLHDLRWSAGTRLLAPGLLGRESLLGDRIESLLRHGRRFSTRPSFANLAVSALLLAMFLGAGGLMPSWIAIAQMKASAAQGAVAPQAFQKLLSRAKFEVASIRPLNPHENTRFANIRTSPNSRWFYAGGANVRMLLRKAYGIQDAQIVGGPSWMRSEQFDIQAEASDSVSAEMRVLPPARAQLVEDYMLQKLLVDRFGLRFHRKEKLLPVYVLVVAKHGPKLVKVDSVGSAAPGHTSPDSKEGQAGWVQPRPGETAMFASSTPISALTSFLSQELLRPVLDETGLKGRYRYELHWMPSLGEMGPFGPTSAPDNRLMAETPQAPGASQPSGPSIFAAIQQQLGLKLKASKGEVEVLVVDHIQEPSPN